MHAFISQRRAEPLFFHFVQTPSFPLLTSTLQGQGPPGHVLRPISSASPEPTQAQERTHLFQTITERKKKKTFLIRLVSSYYQHEAESRRVHHLEPEQPLRKRLSNWNENEVWSEQSCWWIDAAVRIEPKGNLQFVNAPSFFPECSLVFF